MTVAGTNRFPLPPMTPGGHPFLGHIVAFLRDPVALLERGQAVCGNVFRLRLLGKTAIVLIGHEHNKTFFAETDQRLSIRAGYPMFVRMFSPDFYFFAEPEQYHMQRALILPALRGSQVSDYLGIMEAETSAMLDSMGDRGEVDLTAAFGQLAMNIAARTFLGEDFSRIPGLFDTFRDFSAGMDPVLPGWLPLPHLRRSRAAGKTLRELIYKLVADRRRHPVDPPDFLQTLCGARFEDGKALPDPILANLILLLSWAGHETTTGHLSWAVIDLLDNRAELDKVLEEQREVFCDEDSPLTIGHIHRLSYLDRALHETERLHPVAFMLARKATQTFNVGEYLIPRGAMVIASPTVSHRLSDDYPKHDAFHPCRYQDAPDKMRNLIGFGGGSHRCLGIHFAYLEMKVVITLLLRKYQLTLLDTPRPLQGAKIKWPQSPCRIRYQRKMSRR